MFKSLEGGGVLMGKLLRTIITFLALLQQSINSTTASIVPPEEYCEPTLCTLYNGRDFVLKDHIGCGNNGTLAPECDASAKLLDMNQRRIDFILDLHNAARNRIALGQIPGYESADNMPVLKWDHELEFLASLNVKTCKFKHDACRNTHRFQFSGQNIAFRWQSRPFESYSKWIKFFVDKWFAEYKDANQSFIDAYHSHPDGKKIGHFTLLVADRVHRVGCSAIRFKDTINRIFGQKFLMTCNYDFGNLRGEYVYQTGSPASNCTANRPSSRYSGLCKWDDINEESSSTENDEIASTLPSIES